MKPRDGRQVTARPSAKDVQRALERTEATVAWEPGSVPPEVITFLAAAAVDRDTLSREVIALREVISVAEASRLGRLRTEPRLQLMVGLISGAILFLGSLFGSAFFTAPG